MTIRKLLVRVIHTEYQANFGSPKKYQYEEGIWLGAKPPHLLPDEQVRSLTVDHNEKDNSMYILLECIAGFKEEKRKKIY